MRLLRQQTYFRTSIVRVRDMGFSGWGFGCVVANETKSKRLLMENRFGFDWLTIGFLKPVDSRDKPNQNKFTHQDTGIARTNLPPRARWLAKADAA